MKKLSNKNLITLFSTILSLQIVGSFIGFITKASITNWYATLNRSPLTPPNYVFGITWSILYIMIALSGWLIWSSERFPKQLRTQRIFIIQLILNWSWSPLFFSYHLTGASLLLILNLTALVYGLIWMLYKDQKIASLILVPYGLWLSFASYLNAYIWLYN